MNQHSRSLLTGALLAPLSAWLPATAYVPLFGEWRDNVPVGEIIAATVIYGIASTFLSYLFTAGLDVPLALVLRSQNQLSVPYLSLAGLLAVVFPSAP